MATENDDVKFAKLALDRYSKVSDTLRGWLILYGISGAALFITQFTVLSRISTTARFWVIFPSLAGCLLQLLLLVTIKYMDLYSYQAFHPEEHLQKTSWQYRWADWWSKQWYIDIVIDAVTFVLYIIATCVLIFSLSTVVLEREEQNQGDPSSGNQEDQTQSKEEVRQKEVRQKEVRQKEGHQKEKGEKEESEKEEGRQEKKKVTPQPGDGDRREGSYAGSGVRDDKAEAQG